MPDSESRAVRPAQWTLALVVCLCLLMVAALFLATPATAPVHEVVESGSRPGLTRGPREPRAAAPMIAEVPVRPPEPQSGPPHRVVRVVAANSGVGLEGAELDIATRDAVVRHLGRTAEDGRLTVVDGDWSALGQELELLARTPGFALGQLPVPPESAGVDGAELVIALTRAVRIRGTVHASADGELPESLDVLAIPQGRIVYSGVDRGGSPNDVRTDPRWTCAKTTRTGEFEVIGVAPDSVYSVLAVGSGTYAESRVVTPRDGAANCDLSLQGLYAVRARLVDRRGDPITTVRGAVTVPGPAVGLLPEGRWRPLNQTDALFSLLGMSGRAPRSMDHARIDFVFVHDSTPDRLGPLSWALVTPGWKPTTAKLWAFRMNGDVPEQDVTLERADRYVGGELSVEMAPSGSAVRAWADVRPGRELFSVVLQPAVVGDDSIRLYRVPVTRVLPGERHVIRDLPVGMYRAAIDTPYPCDGTAPVRTVEVRSDARTDLVLPPPEGPTLSLRVVAESALDYTGFLSMDLHWNDTRGSAVCTLDFRGPPYRVVALRHGQYRIEVVTQDGRRGEADSMDPAREGQPFVVTVR